MKINCTLSLAVLTCLSFDCIAWSQSLETLEEQLRVLKRFDRNQNQLLEIDEVPSEASNFVAATANKIQKLVNHSEIHIGSEATRQPRTKSGRTSHIDRTTSLQFPVDLAELKRTLASAQPPKKSSEITSGRKLDAVTSSRYASALMLTKDTNNDGVLSGDETKSLSKDWDANRDGKIELAEIAIRLRNMNSRTTHPQKSVAGDSGRNPDSQISPADFSQLDRNHDGQIQMFEFADIWNSQSLSKFTERDANRDGVITRSEWLAHQLAIQKSLERKRQQHD